MVKNSYYYWSVVGHTHIGMPIILGDNLHLRGVIKMVMPDFVRQLQDDTMQATETTKALIVDDIARKKNIHPSSIKLNECIKLTEHVYFVHVNFIDIKTIFCLAYVNQYDDIVYFMGSLLP